MAPGRSRRRAPRTLKITREGRWYIGLTFGVGFAATNTGNNLLFLSLGMLLSLIILSGLLSEAALRNLTVRRVMPREARAGEPVLVGLVVHNGNRLLPSIGLSLVEVDPVGAIGSPARIFRISAGETGRTSLRVTPNRRGRVELHRLKITTSYPFGIFAKSRELSLAGSFLVWPGRVQAGRMELDPSLQERGRVQRRRGGSDDFHGLREFREGDEARMVHWRRSLRVGELLIVEREAPRGHRVTLRLAAGEGERFEDEVRLAAARAEVHLGDGDEVALEVPGEQVPAGAGYAHRRRLLDVLALVEGRPGSEAAG